MKSMNKQIAGVAAAALMAVALSACGSNNNNDANNASTGNAATNNAATNDASTNDASGGNDAAAGKPVTITMMVSGAKAADGADFVLDTLPKLVHEKYPNITLETQKLPDDQYDTSIKTKLAANQGPDIFMVWPKTASTGVIDMAKAGYAADLSDLSFWGNFGKAAKDDMSFDGKPYAVANGMDILGTYYNKDLFAKVGIASAPQDWQSFLDDAQKLKDAGITPIVMGDKDPWVIQFGLYQIAANTVYPDEMDFDTKLQAGEKQLTDPKWVKAISMYQELYDKGYVQKSSLGTGSAQAMQTFVDGKAAMIFDGTWDFGGLTAKGAVDFQRGFFPLPANDAGKPVFLSAATSSGYAINAKSDHIDAVKQVFEYLFDGKSDLFQAWVDSNSSISVYNGVPLKNDLFKDALALYQTTGNAVYFSNQMWPNGVADAMEVKFSEIIGGKKTTADAVAKAMQDKFKELYKG